MFDHIGFRVRDLHASRRFYEAVAASVGLQVIDNSDTSFLIIRSTDKRIPFVWVGTEEPKFWKPGHRVSNSPIHLALSARSTADVDAFHKAALQAGGIDNGKPGPRGPAEAHYYGAYVLDPDGNNIEAGFRGAA
jgi:catechol 2,3-dioxygenase-like lactoylglutathione lyase family enzyme